MRNKITMRSLGSNGRFGNQLWQYAFAKTYAIKNDYELQVPSNWLGRTLFDIPDPPVKEEFKSIELDAFPDGEHSIDLHGYYQHQKYADYMDVDEVRGFFKFKDVWLERFPKVKDYYVACHLRQGDFNVLPNYCTIHPRAYVSSVVKYGYDPEDIVWVSEEIKHEDDTRNYSDDKSWHGNISFLYDFFLLFNADVLFRSNSTFAWWASFLSNKELSYSPVVQGLAGKRNIDVDFVLGNWPCHMEIDSRHSDIHFGK